MWKKINGRDCLTKYMELELTLALSFTLYSSIIFSRAVSQTH